MNKTKLASELVKIAKSLSGGEYRSRDIEEVNKALSNLEFDLEKVVEDLSYGYDPKDYVDFLKTLHVSFSSWETKIKEMKAKIQKEANKIKL